jgi:hypothetical protein
MNSFCQVLIALLIAGVAAAQDNFRLRVSYSEPARFYLDDANGKSWAPDRAIVYRNRAERHFVTANGFEIELPAGTYTFTAERGPEFRPFRQTIEGRAGADINVKVELERPLNLNRLGWYSGDLHNHRRPEDMRLLLLAEDLNLAPTLTDWVWDDRQRTQPPDTSEPIRSVDARHVYSVLDKEVERLRDGPGAVDLLGLRSPILFNGSLLYPSNDTFTRQAHAQGAWVDAEKIVWRDVAALVALGHIDFAGIVYNHFNRQDVETETDSWGMIPKSRPEFKTPFGMPLWAMDVYYRLLNCGFRLPVSGGSASGVKSAPLGYNRVYVKPAGQFSYENWFRGLKQGRSFATNGPMLFLTVDGKEPGAVIRPSEKGRRRAAIRAEAFSLKPMDRLEIIYRGKTIRSVTGAGKLMLNFTADVDGTGWFVARAFEKPDSTIRFAHTSPVYVEFPGDSGIVTEDAQFFIDWIDREIRFFKNLPRFQEPRHRDAMLRLFEDARRVYEKLTSGGASEEKP